MTDQKYLPLGLRIAAYRARKDLRQRELAAIMDIDPSVLSKLENGTRRATRAQAEWLREHANIALSHWGYR